jgi:hypothetical protein
MKALVSVHGRDPPCCFPQLHEQRFNSFGPSEESGSFVIDKYIGQKTSFSCFALYPGNAESGYVKSIMIEDRKGNRFKSIVDSMSAYHLLSLYNVPFESVRQNTFFADQSFSIRTFHEFFCVMPGVEH